MCNINVILPFGAGIKIIDINRILNNITGNPAMLNNFEIYWYVLFLYYLIK